MMRSYFALMKETKQSEVDELFQILLHTRRDAEIVNGTFKVNRRKSMLHESSTEGSPPSHQEPRSSGDLLGAKKPAAAQKAPSRHASRSLPEKEREAAAYSQEEGEGEVAGRTETEADTGAGKLAAHLRSSVLCNQKIESSPFFSDQRAHDNGALRDAGFLTEAGLGHIRGVGMGD